MDKSVPHGNCCQCTKTYGTLGCCSTVNNEWLYSCEEGMTEWNKREAATSDLFRSIKAVIRTEGIENAGSVFVIDEGPDYIEVEVIKDDEPPHRYKIVDDNLINRKWLDSKLVISNRVDCVDRETLLDWLETAIEPQMLMTLNCILLINDNSEDEFDTVIQQDPRVYDALVEQGIDLPQDDLIGEFKSHANMPIVTVGKIQQLLKNLFPCPTDRDVSESVLLTLAHEIRHLAQSNDFLPASVLNQKGKNESDAEDYAWNVVSSNCPCIMRTKGE